MKKSKPAYYNKYFETNRKNAKSIWKEIKPLISLKTVASGIPPVLFLDNGDIITNPYHTANTFKNFFASMAETTKKSINFLFKKNSDYLGNENCGTIFKQPTDKEEIANIKSSLNSIRFFGQIVYIPYIEYYFF